MNPYLVALVIGIGIGLGIVLIWAMMNTGWKRVLASLAVYLVDIGMAVIGYTMGFGLDVKSWVWLIGTMFIGRFVFYMVQNALHVREAKDYHANLSREAIEELVDKKIDALVALTLDAGLDIREAKQHG